MCSRDYGCLIVNGCAQKEHSHSLSAQLQCSSFRQLLMRLQLLSDSLAFFVFPANLQFVVKLEKTKWCSTLFNNMGSFNRKNEFRKAENIDKPISSK